MSNAAALLERFQKAKERGRKSRPCRTCQASPLRSDGLYVLAVPWGAKNNARAAIGSLRQAGAEVQTIERGEGNWKDEVVASAKARRPDLFLTWQRLYSGWGAEVARVLDEYMVPRLVMDFGVYPHYGSVIFDRIGENATSEMVGRLDVFEQEPHWRRAADRQRPLLDQWQAQLRDDAFRARSEYEYEFDNYPDSPFALVVLQRTGDQVLRFDAEKKRAETVRLITDLIREAERQQRYLIFKRHPLDQTVTQALKEGKLKHRGPWHEFWCSQKAPNEVALAELLSRCAYVITVNSTVHLTALAMGKPVVTLGQGWFTGNRVTSEFKSIAGAVRGPDPAIDPARGERYVLHMLSRQLAAADCANPAKVQALVSQFYPRQSGMRDVTVITTVYADEQIEPQVIQCLDAVADTMPGAPHTVCVDYARPEFIQRLREKGVTVMQPEGGNPPRMARMLHDAIKAAATRYVMTVEQDVILHPGAGEKLLRTLEPLDCRVAQVEGRYVDTRGHQCFPLTRTRKDEVPSVLPGIVVTKTHCCWGLTMQRREAMLAVSWDGLPRYGQSDVQMGERLRAMGMVLVRDHAAKATHHIHQGYKARKRHRCSRGTSGGRQCVYTVVTAGYDQIRPDPVFLGWDYVCFVDDENAAVCEPWRKVVFDTKGHPPRLASRLPKILAHEYLPEYSRSIYHDAALCLNGDPARFEQNVGSADYAVMAPANGIRAYQEARAVARLRRAPQEAVDAAIAACRLDGLPETFPSTENGVLWRRHNEPWVRDFDAQWWREFLRLGIGRDQFPFALTWYKTGADLLIFDIACRNKSFVKWRRHTAPYDQEPGYAQETGCTQTA